MYQVESNQVGLIKNSVIVLKIRKEDVTSITKNGADVIITLKKWGSDYCTKLF
ncbi:BapA prefix-like domain-containing protein [Acinetobacter sp. YH12086]|uniref:BapA/Bap/LapF family prefix-like domain-containing protein n=1 Tax=Acinetobacter TaxID=469 RepID=UPI0015D3391A